MANGAINGRLLMAVIGAMFVIIQGLVGYFVMDIRADVKETGDDIKVVRSAMILLQEQTIRRTIIDSVTILSLDRRVSGLEDNP